MTENDGARSRRFILAAQAIVLGALMWVGWHVKEIRARSLRQNSSATLEWVMQRPNGAPVKITIDLVDGESRESWEFRLATALQRAGDVR